MLSKTSTRIYHFSSLGIVLIVFRRRDFIKVCLVLNVKSRLAVIRTANIRVHTWGSLSFGNHYIEDNLAGPPTL